MATNPTPGPSESPQTDPAQTQSDTTPETVASEADVDVIERPADEAEPDGAGPDIVAETDTATTADPSATAASEPDAAPAAPKVTPADLIAAAKGAVGSPAASAASLARHADDPTGTSGSVEPSTSPTPAADSQTVTGDEWGRVDVNGDVFLRTAEGERHIGSWQVGEPEKALAFYRRKFEDLVVQVDLIEQRLSSGAASPDSAENGVAKLREALTEPHAIGDLDSLRARLDAVEGQVSERRAERKAARAQELDDARARKESVAAEAEQLAEGNDWRHGADRLRQLLDEWKALPRLDRATDDTLWRRFSTARTHYTRRRKAHFAELADRRDGARDLKEEILAEAEPLAESTEWGDTARKFRDLMSRWKAAGPAPRSADEALWKRFRAAQDTFFEARTATFTQRDTEQQTNLDAKEALLTEAEALMPISDWKAARTSLRSIQDRWEVVGHVPREAMKSIEARLRKVEDAIRHAEESDWQRSNPEGKARAEDTVAQLRASISELEAKAAKARDAGNERKAAEAEESAAARRAWLEQAEQALNDFR